MKKIYKAISLIVLISGLFISEGRAQSITISRETFPSQYNTGFGNPATNNCNGNFSGSIGSWTSSGDNIAALAVVSAYYSPVTYAIKIVNWNTAGKGAGTCRATSPAINLAGYNCAPSMNLTFILYTYASNAADVNSFLTLEFTTDNGATWSTAWSMSSANIFANWGGNNIANITVPISQAYRVSNFKYRFSGLKPANQPNNFYVFIDDITILANPCTQSFKLGNMVWYDRNTDGSKQGNEDPIANVTVNLYNDANNDNLPDGVPVSTTTTNNAGWYNYSNLGAGNYIVGIVPPTGYTKGIVNGGDPDSDYDNDNNGINLVNGEVRGNAISLSAGAEKDSLGNSNSNYNATYDIGLIGTASLGDYLWNDANRNGLQDAFENGMAGRQVLLKNAAGTATLATTQTDSNGRYRFNNLAPGTYTLKFPGIQLKVPTQPMVGSNMEINSKPDSLTSSYQVSLSAYQVNLTIDAGYKSAGILPIIMGDFTGVYRDGFTQLNWNTLSEQNLDHFIVERSADAISYTEIGYVVAKGGSVNTGYMFSDILVKPGMNYYRIKSVDKDGEVNLSKVVAVNTSAKGVSLLLVYPNPFGHKVQVKIESESTATARIRILNMGGAVIRQQDEIVRAGENIFVLKDVSQLPPGIYYLEIIAGNKNFTTKIIKQE